MQIQLDYNDLVLLQASNGLNSRSDAIIDENIFFTAPMDTVISPSNAKLFRDKGINICYPRGLEIFYSKTDFVSVGLDEFDKLVDGEFDMNEYKICIDVANGNMPRLHNSIKRAKQKWPNVIIMSGNVGNMRAFMELAQSGCDYIRVNIGSGSACLTSVHAAVGQGCVTLLQDCKSIRDENNLETKIVMDGGFKTYRDIIIALACGADHIMTGHFFSKCLESCAPKYKKTISGDFIELQNADKDTLLHLMGAKNLYVPYRGMSTKAVQRDWGKEHLKSSEGIEKMNLVEYTLDGWLENFYDYLKSSMAYVGATNLTEFRNETHIAQISQNAFSRFYK